MKIYTQTWFKGYNYGTVLQAYALSEYISSLGYDCSILGYRPNAAEQWRLKLINRNIIATIRYKINEAAMKKNKTGLDNSTNNYECFEKFRKDCMRISPECTSVKKIEEVCGSDSIFICGSDQIWNPYMYNPCYYLEFVKDPNRKIAYAPSFGVSEIPNYNRKRVRNALSSFKHISLREKRGTEIVKELIGKKAVVTVDPTLLLTDEQWLSLSQSQEAASDEPPYIFCYFLSENQRYFQIAHELADKFGLNIRMLPMVAEDYKKKETIKEAVGPKEWINLIRGASFVLTDSFHCTLFALRFHKSFYTLQRFSENDKKGQNARITNLFSLTGFSDRLLLPKETEKEYSTIASERFEHSDAQLKKETDTSKKWLESCLNECKSFLEGNK